MLREAAEGADLLVHEATFMETERDRARETGHSTARQAALLAADADVGLLALTHLSTRYHPRDVLDEARAVFARAVLPRDLESVEVPFVEKGLPELLGREDSRAAAAAAAPAS
jgi:ribonuclease Z